MNVHQLIHELPLPVHGNISITLWFYEENNLEDHSLYTYRCVWVKDNINILYPR